MARETQKKEILRPYHGALDVFLLRNERFGLRVIYLVTRPSYWKNTVQTPNRSDV
jgi:hypothetical protein